MTDDIRFTCKGIRSGLNKADNSCVPLRLKVREWDLVYKALLNVDVTRIVEDTNELAKTKKEILWLTQKIGCKMRGAKVPQKPAWAP